MRIARLVVGVAALVIGSMTGAAASTPGGTAIANAVTATYTDGAHTYTTQSNTVVETVASVSALTVTPKNGSVDPSTDAFTLGAPVTRTFVITNTSNIPDAYLLTSVTASAGSVTSEAFVANGVSSNANGTVSPTVQPGGTVSVVVTVATAGVPVNTPIAIAITARTTVAGTQTGFVSDSGRQWAISLGVPQFGGTGGATTSVAKTVDGLTSESNAPGATVTYTIAFENWGQVAATNSKLTDAVPVGITADPTSVKVNGIAAAATLNGQTLSVPLGSLAPNVPMTVTFRAAVASTLSLGTSYVNTASLSADGVAALATTPASVFVGTADVVYDGLKGPQAPIAGALVALVNATTGQPLAFATAASVARSSTGSAPAQVNPQNTNPFRTGANGVYGFTIPAPPSGTTTHFDILVSASGYISRIVDAAITPSATGTLYTVVLTAKDGLPLASAGGFTLTTSSVMLSDVFSLLGNLPMFTPQSIAVNKSADKTQAAPGDRIAYTVTAADNGTYALGATTIDDAMPAGLAYAPGTARVDGASVEPAVHGGHLVWTLAGMQPSAVHTITYECVLLPSVSPGTTLTNVVTATGTVAGTQVNATGSGSVGVVAVDGAFSTQAVITGRVFIDDAHTGHFRLGDRPVAGVRVVLEDGEQVTTDPDGRYSFPGVRPGMHVLRLDETTIPAIARASSDRRYDSPRSPLRLVHGTLDMGLLQDVNFALEPVR